MNPNDFIPRGFPFKFHEIHIPLMLLHLEDAPTARLLLEAVLSRIETLRELVDDYSTSQDTRERYLDDLKSYYVFRKGLSDMIDAAELGVQR